jgi:phosphoglycerol transferase MdoB-like AlkP superfamily enzyme
VIATAAYGSELAAPVQFLRDFRDNQVQKTALGSTFLTAFNGWYYSWAPGIAQRIAPNENYKAVTRAIIAPLIGSLFVGNTVFSALALLNPELAIISAGLMSSALIGLAYLTPAYAIAWKLSKRRMTKRTIYGLAIVAAALTFMATLTTGTFSLASNLTALAVVETLLLTPAFILRKMKQVLSYGGVR